ncbi:hypothetical protein [Streptomyces sp. NRRL B-3648]|uniref:hypothetical protein n=1 Tax=Streptomyces sp. NRRL B-3648 TaxID=1519493 RepID=UPI0006C6FEF1|nr:hypothetical protein [Streptomyces sp. NRRL B-3648]KOX05281.1 hypothetical protein ADL04_07495 [Streptomyces sp. NRRL B-3648]
MSTWTSMAVAEQALLRRAMQRHQLAGMVQYYGAALRWAGDSEAPPPRSYTQGEARELVPRLAEAALGLVERGLLDVHQASGPWSASSDPVLSGRELHGVLTDPDQWIPTTPSTDRIWLSVPEAVDARFRAEAFPAPQSGGFPPAGERTGIEEELLVCTYEVSGWLTGPYGVLRSPEAEWSLEERLAWVEPQVAPLVQWAGKGWIEVCYFPDPKKGCTVIPAGELLATLADPAVWHEDDDWGAGVTCCFTDAGLGAWRA